jgi:Secretion system C-terminal sorting domain
MKNNASATAFFALFALIIFSLPILTRTETPEAGEGDEEEQRRREAYFENMHRAAPDANWRAMEAKNMLQQYETNLRNRNLAQSRTTFAGGLLNGTWYERGSTNNAGSMIAVDYDVPTNQIYSISAGGSLWRSNLTGSNWTSLSNNLSFSPRFVNVLPTSGGHRILAGLNQQIAFSDDEGATFAPSAGMSYPVAWGGNYVRETVVLNDANKTVYALVQAWNPSPWASRFHLYRSIDKGISFTKIHTFTHGDAKGTSLYVPYNSAICYILDSNDTDGNGVNTTSLYSVDGGTTLTTISANTGMNTFDYAQITGNLTGSTQVFYALMEKDRVYRSTNGINWTLQSTLPATGKAWDVGLAVALSDPNKLQYGNINNYRSTDAGATWNPVNYWYDYYTQEATKLHADIMSMRYFKKTDGTEFVINNNHGGVYISYDQMATVANIGLSNLNVSQYYDVRTCPWDVNLCHVGTQDQGEQNSIAANSTAAIPFVQVISGDNGQMVYTRSGTQTYIWTEYPGGQMEMHRNPYGTTYGSGNYITWSMQGTDKPDAAWMLATSPTANSASAHEILIGGGNVTGGSGSYLVKLSSDGTSFFQNQYPYNFRSNSNNGTSGISAIGTTTKDPNRYYVATEDGAFFYSTDQGANWTKSASFTGPTAFYLYGNAILTSKRDANLVYYGGSGYSNPGFYRSTNGGVSFTALTNGLPATLISDLAFTPNEAFIFAATDAGPYVYSVTNNQWYSLQDAAGTPAYVTYTSVEFVQASNTARFATYGRGVWDLVLTTALPVELTEFKAKAVDNLTIDLNWSVATATNFDKYVVERSADGKDFTRLGDVKSKSNQAATYRFSDDKPLVGTNYYRLKMVDTDGKTTYSTIETAVINPTKTWKVYPNSLSKNGPLSIELPSGIEVANLQLFDLSGRLVKESKLTNRTDVGVSELNSGVYLYQITAGRDRSSGKIFVF